MLSVSENELLCRVGPGTPMGNVFRRFWNPVLLSSQLPSINTAPVRLEALGEKLVAYRMPGGDIGLMNEMCMHRNASLALGRIEADGIRCLYHGWKFDPKGAILETPNHADPRFRERLKSKAYPVKEAGGLIWAYMGPADKQPAFPHWRFMDLPLEHVRIRRSDANVNYMQQLEGGTDTSHVGILHSNAARPGWMTGESTQSDDPDNPAGLASGDLAPELEVEDTEFGFHYAALRKVGGRKEDVNVRIVPVLMPTTRIIPSAALQFVVFEVPLNDTRTASFNATFRVDGGPIDAAKIDQIVGRSNPELFSPDHQYLGTWDNRFGQDIQRMNESWSGIEGVGPEDLAIAMSQGAISDRSTEHLVAADKAVVRARKQLLDSARSVLAGGDPIGFDCDISRVAAYDRTIERRVPWQTLAPDHRTRVAA